MNGVHRMKRVMAWWVGAQNNRNLDQISVERIRLVLGDREDRGDQGVLGCRVGSKAGLQR